MKKKNPAAARDGSEVRRATDVPWSRSDLKPLRLDLKKGDRYRLHIQFDGIDFEAPDTEYWDDLTINVEVIDSGRGWIDERVWTRNLVTRINRPRGFGWTYEGPGRGNSSFWVRRRKVRR